MGGGVTRALHMPPTPGLGRGVPPTWSPQLSHNAAGMLGMIFSAFVSPGTLTKFPPRGLFISFKTHVAVVSLLSRPSPEPHVLRGLSQAMGGCVHSDGLRPARGGHGIGLSIDPGSRVFQRLSGFSDTLIRLTERRAGK